jgi:predicted O-methyltransferase YrrM
MIQSCRFGRPGVLFMVQCSSLPNFEAIAVRCSGMLAPAIYRRLYETAFSAPDGFVVEIGTAMGAATVSLALGLQDAGKRGRVITVDRGVPRAGGGNPAIYRDRVKANLRHFGVEDRVELFAGEAADAVKVVPASAPISVLMIDADGAIDRDLRTFFDRVIPGGDIVIDDCLDVVRLHRSGLFAVRVDAKMRLTHLLLSYFKQKGLLSEGMQIKDTYFGKKLLELSQTDISTDAILDIYRRMTFSSGRLVPAFADRTVIVRLMNLISPDLTQRLRVRHRRSVERTSVSRV